MHGQFYMKRETDSLFKFSYKILASANNLQVLHVISFGSQGHPWLQKPGQYSIPSSFSKPFFHWLTRPLMVPFEFFFARSLSGIFTARCLISFQKLTHLNF